MSLGRAVHQKARSPARNAGSEVKPRPTRCVIKRGRRGMAWSLKPRAIRRCLHRRSRARTSRRRGTASNSRAGLSILDSEPPESAGAPDSGVLAEWPLPGACAGTWDPRAGVCHARSRVVS